MSIGFLCPVCPAVTNMEVVRQEKKWTDTPLTRPIRQQLSCRLQSAWSQFYTSVQCYTVKSGGLCTQVCIYLSCLCTQGLQTLGAEVLGVATLGPLLNIKCQFAQSGQRGAGTGSLLVSNG